MPLYRVQGEQRIQGFWIVSADSPEDAERQVVENDEKPDEITGVIETEVWDDPVEIQRASIQQNG